jgi:monooxygenase
MSHPHFDVLIVGAGLSGIGTACQIAQAFPDRSIAVLERRDSLGGTWDLFRYPGIRSDSDMFTFGYRMHPWHDPKVMADGPSIRRYIADTARAFGIDSKIHYGLKIVGGDWSSIDQRWTVTALREATGDTRTYSCRFLITCTGYYNHDAGYLPAFPGEEHFKGLRVHPQHWPENLDYAGKRVVVIGSGATAVTLIPAMADKTAHITMLQRSPSYIVSVPGVDAISAWLRHVLPASMVYGFARWRNLLLQRGLYLACRRWPKAMRSLLLSEVRRHVGKNVDMRHFTPSYMPWDQRVCVVPDADLFEKLKSGKASVVTDQIDTFTEHGIRLKSGKLLEADIVITATGLNIQLLGGMQLSVDGKPQHLHDHLTYKGVLLQDIPNLAVVFGYTNAPWTLRADLTAAYLCRLLSHMDATGQSVVVAHDTDDCRIDASIMGSLSSGYVQRDNTMLPRQGSRYPWQVSHHYGRDIDMLLKQPVEDAWLRFSAAVGLERLRGS